MSCVLCFVFCVCFVFYTPKHEACGLCVVLCCAVCCVLRVVCNVFSGACCAVWETCQNRYKREWFQIVLVVASMKLREFLRRVVRERNVIRFFSHKD